MSTSSETLNELNRSLKELTRLLAGRNRCKCPQPYLAGWGWEYRKHTQSCDLRNVLLTEKEIETTIFWPGSITKQLLKERARMAVGCPPEVVNKYRNFSIDGPWNRFKWWLDKRNSARKYIAYRCVYLVLVLEMKNDYQIAHRCKTRDEFESMLEKPMVWVNNRKVDTICQVAVSKFLS